MAKRVASIIFFLLSAPVTVSAQVVISELMYDLASGSDSGREWIEVYNESGAVIDLTEWKFFENNTNHGITPVGASQVPSGAYAVIADNPEKFKADYPAYGGLLFDSAFSLNNSGETLVLRCCGKELSDKDSVAYSSDLGGAGDGASLSRSGSSFVPTDPTPGSAPSAARTKPEPESAPPPPPKLPEPPPAAEKKIELTTTEPSAQETSLAVTKNDIITKEEVVKAPAPKKKIPQPELEVETSESKVADNGESVIEPQVAAVAASDTKQWLWWMGALCVAFFGATGAYMIGSIHSREWKIIEETDDTE